MNGDNTTGVTIMEMVEKLDAGDIIIKKEVKINSDSNYGELSKDLSVEGGKLLLKALNLIEQGLDERVQQDNKLHTYAKKIKNEEKYLNLNHDAIDIVNTIRGLTPKITPLLVLNNQYLGIVEAEVASTVTDNAFDSANVGEVLNIDKKSGILVKCAIGAIWIKKLKPEGKKTMDFKDFINGKKIHVGDILKNKEEN
jgi:methionyl-tRNA formyltransferase